MPNANQELDVMCFFRGTVNRMAVDRFGTVGLIFGHSERVLSGVTGILFLVFVHCGAANDP